VSASRRSAVRAEPFDETLESWLGCDGVRLATRASTIGLRRWVQARADPVAANPHLVVGGRPSVRSMGRVLRYDGLMPHVLPSSGLGMARDDRGDAVRVVPGLLAVQPVVYLHAFANRHACFHARASGIAR